MKNATAKYCNNLIKDLAESAKEYQDAVVQVASKYRRDVEDANKAAEKKYPLNIRPDDVMSLFDSDTRRRKQEETEVQQKVVDEYRKTYVDSKKDSLIPRAVQAIRDAQNTFHEKAQSTAKELRKQIEGDAAASINSAFMNYATVFNTFDIGLTEIDLGTLVNFADGHPLALRIISDLVKKNDCPFEFKYKTLESYNDDIKTIETLGMEGFCVPAEFLHEIVELFDGKEIYPNKGDSLKSKLASGFGATFDRTMIAAFHGLFDSSLKKLDAMTTLPDENEGTKETWDCWLKPASYKVDVSMQLAKEIGQQTAQANQPVSESLGNMVK